MGTPEISGRNVCTCQKDKVIRLSIKTEMNKTYPIRSVLKTVLWKSDGIRRIITKRGLTSDRPRDIFN